MRYMGILIFENALIAECAKWRFLRREIGKLRDKTKISHIVRSMTVNHYNYHILPAYYSAFDYTDIEAI
jgi:hypothetical protein